MHKKTGDETVSWFLDTVNNPEILLRSRRGGNLPPAQ